MSIISIILIALLVILLFRVGFAILRFLISAALVLLGLYLGYQGILWILENFHSLSAFIQ
ncbi:hypothetical protein HYI43_05870 [Staphylococcus taiwanensis]|nr:hypothetical protein HYI43_05870 [Staphylococcus taiwanensis]